MNLFKSNDYFNKLFFEFNFFKFKIQDNLSKNLYYLYNFFTKSKIKCNTLIHGDLKLNELYAANTSLFPEDGEFLDLKDLIFGAPPVENMSSSSYLSFFVPEDVEEPLKFISPEAVFDIIRRRRFPRPERGVIERTIQPYNYNYDFLNFRYLFNQILKYTVFQNFEEFLNKKYKVLTMISLEDYSFFDSVNFFWASIISGLTVFNNEVTPWWISIRKFTIKPEFTEFEAVEESDDYAPIDDDFKDDIHYTKSSLADTKDYYASLIDDYSIFEKKITQTYNLTTFWDNSFFGFSNRSHFNYLYLLNAFLFRKEKIKFDDKSRSKHEGSDYKLTNIIIYNSYFTDSLNFNISDIIFDCLNFTYFDDSDIQYYFLYNLIYRFSCYYIFLNVMPIYLNLTHFYGEPADLRKKWYKDFYENCTRARVYKPYFTMGSPFGDRPRFVFHHNKFFVTNISKKLLNPDSCTNNKFIDYTRKLKPYKFVSFFDTERNKFNYREFFLYKKIKYHRRAQWADIRKLKKKISYFTCPKPQYNDIEYQDRLLDSEKYFYKLSNYYEYKHGNYIFDKIKFVYTDNFKFSLFFLNFFKQFRGTVMQLLMSTRLGSRAMVDFFKISISFNFFYFVNLAPATTIRLFTKQFRNSRKYNEQDKELTMLHGMCNTNYTPIYFFTDSVRIKFKRFFKGTRISSATFFYQYFLVQSLEFLLNCKVYIKVFSLMKLVIAMKKNNFFKFIRFKYRYYNSRVGKGFFLVETLQVLWITFLFKDPDFFMAWFTKTMQRLYFRKQKFFIHFLKIVLLRHFCQKFYKELGFSGFLFDIRGKVGVSGNSKKRHVQFNWGVTSLSKKCLRLKYTHGLVHTHTGVMGVTLFISY